MRVEISIHGFIGDDAVIKEINNKKYIAFNVASTKKSQDKETTTWFSILKQDFEGSDKLLALLKKGSLVFVQGSPKFKANTKDGETYMNISVMADTILNLTKSAE